MDVFVNQGGTPVECEVYRNNGGTPELIYTPVMVVDNFEDGDHAGWTVATSTGGDTILSSGFDGTSYAWQFQQFREAHLAGADAVERGPQPGDRFELWFQLDSQSGAVINRFKFSADGITDGDCYQFEFQHTSDPEWRMQKLSGGSVSEQSLENGQPSVGQTYRVVFDWNYSTWNELSAQVFTAGGNTVTSPLTLTEDSSGLGAEYSQPGIVLRNNDNATTTWDEIKITDTN